MPRPTTGVPVVRAPLPRVVSSALVASLLLTAACAPGLKPIAGAAPAPAPTRAAEPERVVRSDMAEDEYLHARQLMVPVAGVEPHRLSDTFSAPRDGGARTHRAIDIMAPRGTPVLAADDGRVLRVSHNRLGGLTIYAIDDEERFVYYYAHLDRYRDGLRGGMRIARGEVIGYVGSTGNASASAPHLHFQAMRYRPGRYWDGEPVNPLPYLAIAGRPQGTAVTSGEQDQDEQREQRDQRRDR
ncbi:MAG TPA: M23 family metallopeptidase [Gemmatimonadales bacterium]